MQQYRYTPSFGGLPSINPEDSKVLIISCPLETTTTYKKGTREGPQAILLASYNLELYDEELDDIPAEVGIYTHPDLSLSLGNLKKALEEIENFTFNIIDYKHFPVFLGGEHTITKAILRAYTKKYDSFSILHLDAHSDLRGEYEGTENSHACALREASEKIKIVQVGIRSMSEEEKDYVKERENIKIYFDYKLQEKFDAFVVEDILKNLEEEVYITLDFDVFNPSEMPAVGTPEPGGLSWYQVLYLLREVFKNKKVIGADFVEFSPIPGLVYPDYMAARLIYKTIGYYKKYSLRA
ncbi:MULTISPECIES: agmatinase [Dictyoglomus]|jgi:agmatinase|uniref:agmatinase n=1 Tax=Dictyoglomus TaxID=13 RepID=UPI000CCE7142|nr:agmatinase [Dictyoglomus turgidum]PNV78813.1 MAG: agmatinase [Dictyoglomus turgidum]